MAKARAAMAEIDDRRAARAIERAAERGRSDHEHVKSVERAEGIEHSAPVKVAPTEVRRLISKWRLGIVDKDEELIERYQRAAVTARARGNEVRRARADGKVLYLEEDEAATAVGEAAAYGWLLGDPVSPQRRLATLASDETMIAEYLAAEDECEAGKARFAARRDGPEQFGIDQAYAYAAGVRSALFWALSRNRPTAVAN